MCRVLIIDDDPYSAETIKFILEDAGEAQPKISTDFEDAQKQVKRAIHRNKPFEVFLIDQRLGPGKDGIEVMQELRTISPDSDAIIFTGVEDLENGVRAYEAGAFRYLSKPFENRELLFLLKSLKQWRREQREHGWQKVFTSMMEAALRKESFRDVSNTVVKYALELGFSRVHLFWVPTREDVNTNDLMIGVACAGDDCVPEFPTGKGLYPFEQWFGIGQKKQTRDVVFLRPEQVKKIQEQALAFGYHWPAGEVAILPLWGSNSLLGALMLDYGQQEKAITEHERSLLNFFARQVAIVLENVSLLNREKRLAQDTAIVSHIGRQVMAKAIDEINLSELLDEVHDQIDLLMDVSNFAFFLLDSESNEIDLRLFYERGLRCKDLPRPSSMVIERFLLAQEANNIFWVSDVQEHFQESQIFLEGETPISCIGVRLQVGEKIVGGITVKRYEGEEQFTRREHELLSAVANQIAGAIQLIHTNEVEKRDAARLEVLRRTMMEMLRIAQENEDDLWLTALTFATAHFGTGFNRALLFLENDEHTLLIGKAGVGTNDPGMARCDWENDRKRGYQFDDFLTELRQKKIHFTDLHTLAHDMVFQTAQPNSIIHQAMQDGQRKIVQQDKVKQYLPREITNRVELGECAVLPIPSGDRIIGVAIVDNKHNGRPLNEKMLNHLQTLLNYTGLVWETLRQQSRSESLLDVNHQIMGEARLQSLKDTLRNICKTAKEFTEADWVLIYPLKEGKKYEFDTANATYIGNLKSFEDVIKEKPSPNGMSSHVLRIGKLVIQDVDNTDLVIGDALISKHEFIMRERVKAMIGMVIQDVQRDEPLGILYLDYRTPQNFSELDEHHAKSFASLAAVAISNARRFDEQRQRQRLDAALQTAEATGTELNMEKMLKQVLRKLNKFLDQTTACVLTYDEDENALKFAPATLDFYKIENQKFYKNNIYPLRGKSIACRVARKAKRTRRVEFENVPDVKKDKDYLELIFWTNSELCISLMSSERNLLGVLVLERAEKYGFDDDDVALMKTVARQLSMAIERSQKNAELDFRSTVAAAYAWASDIAHDINREVGEIRKWAYLIKEKSTDSKLSEYADKIEASASILSMAGPWTNPEDEIVRLDEAIAHTVEKMARQRGIQAEMDLGCDSIYVKINPIGFRRVIGQLVRNAGQAMRNLSEKKIIIRTKPVGNAWVEIQIQDFGPGISDEIRASILQRQVTTKERGGFGLLLTRQMIENMDGKIRLLSSSSEEGATFSIRLPRIKAV